MSVVCGSKSVCVQAAKKGTAPSVPKWSPIPVLMGPNEVNLLPCPVLLVLALMVKIRFLWPKHTGFNVIHGYGAQVSMHLSLGHFQGIAKLCTRVTSF